MFVEFGNLLLVDGVVEHGEPEHAEEKHVRHELEHKLRRIHHGGVPGTPLAVRNVVYGTFFVGREVLPVELLLDVEVADDVLLGLESERRPSLVQVAHVHVVLVLVCVCVRSGLLRRLLGLRAVEQSHVGGTRAAAQQRRLSNLVARNPGASALQSQHLLDTASVKRHFWCSGSWLQAPSVWTGAEHRLNESMSA